MLRFVCGILSLNDPNQTCYYIFSVPSFKVVVSTLNRSVACLYDCIKLSILSNASLYAFGYRNFIFVQISHVNNTLGLIDFTIFLRSIIQLKWFKVGLVIFKSIIFF